MTEIEEPKLGRPSEFTIETMTEICERMSEGKSLRHICDDDPEMPRRRTVLRWVKNDDAAKKLYDAAQEQRMHWYADELITIAYDTSNDTIKGKDGQDLCNHEWIARSRLKVDTLKFIMAKMAPKSYGDKLPETVEDRNLKISWDNGTPREPITAIRRIIINGFEEPVQDDDGSIIDCDDPAKLRARIRTLEERLGMREGQPPPPKLIAYDPGPLPARLDPEVLARFLRMIKDTVPQADQRPPETVLDEVLSECERALQEKYGNEASDQFQPPTSGLPSA